MVLEGHWELAFGFDPYVEAFELLPLIDRCGADNGAVWGPWARSHSRG